MARAKVSMNALVVTHPHRWAVSVTLTPCARSILAGKMRTLVRHRG